MPGIQTHRIAKAFVGMAFLAVIALMPGRATAQETFGDCAGAPPEAKTVIPAPLDQIMQVYCTPGGQFIHGLDAPEQGVSYRWTRVDVTQPVVMYARFDGSKGGYFTAFNLTPMVGLGKTAAVDRYAKIVTWNGTDPQVYSLRATNDLGQTRALVVMIAPEQSGGFVCDDGQCQNILAFQIIKLTK